MLQVHYCTWDYSHRFIGLQHIPIAGLLVYRSVKMQKNLEREAIKEEQLVEEQQIEEVRSPESVISLLQVDPIEFEFGYGLIPLADTQQGGDLLDRIILIRRQCALNLGSLYLLSEFATIFN